MASIGDFVIIKESTLDKLIATALQQNKPTVASKWDQMRNVSLKVIEVRGNGGITAIDAYGRQYELGKTSYDVVDMVG
jgi:hypothetical protein